MLTERRSVLTKYRFHLKSRPLRKTALIFHFSTLKAIEMGSPSQSSKQTQIIVKYFSYFIYILPE